MKCQSLAIALLACLFPAAAFSQGSPQQRIEEKLSEIKSMDEEELRVLDQLRKQLSGAMDRENLEHIDRLQGEIQSLTNRRGKLQDYREQLEMLLESVGERENAVVQPQLADGNTVPPRPAAQPLNVENNRIVRELVRAFADGSPGNPGVIQGGQRGAREIQPPRPINRWNFNRPIADEPQAPTSRLDHLQDSLQHLNDAGEIEMARQIELLISREKKRIQQARIQQQPTKQPPLVGREIPPSKSPPGGDDQDQQQLVDELRSVILQMRDEISSLRGEVKRLRDGDRRP